MKIIVMNKNFEAISYYEDFVSLLWTDRYDECGDFELYVPYSDININILQMNNYIWCDESDHIMIIESVQLQTDVEDGSYITVSGRSLESILDRRIIWAQTNIDTNLQDGIKRLINDSIISPVDGKRKINNFIFEDTTDPQITSVKFEAQYTGDNLYETVSSICKTNKIGFKVTLDEQNRFVFKLYSGIDRSYAQDKNLFVTFSPSFDNVISSNYIESYKTYKNVTLVAGEGEGAERKTFMVTEKDSEFSGLDRREHFTDARDISTKTDNDITLSDAEYNAKLKERGLENLKDNKITMSFEGEYETTGMYKYEQDFFVGDVVQVVTEYGREERVRVSEMIRSIDEKGYNTYPTFISEKED